MCVFVYIYIYIYMYNFIQLVFGCAGSSWLCRLFSSVESRGYSPVVVRGLFIAVTSLCYRQNTSSRVCKLQQLWHVGLVVFVPEFQSTGSIVVTHGLTFSAVCGIFLCQGLDYVSCIGRQILYHGGTRHQGCPRIFFKYKLQNYSFNSFF